MKQKNLLSANLILAIISTVFFGSFFAANSVSASHATAVCETNTMKSGTFCNWTDSKSWCGGNTLTCQLEPDTATTPPTAVANGSWNFCNSCSWTLTCNGGFTKCAASTTCIITKTCLAGQTFNACTNLCEGTVATLKLAFDSVGSSYLVNSSNPVLSIGSDGKVGIGITAPGTNLDIAGTFRNSLATTHSLLAGAGNVVVMADPTGTLYQASLSTFLSTFASSTSLWGGTKDGNIWNGTAGAGNVGIGTTDPGNYKLNVNGYFKSNGFDDGAVYPYTKTIINDADAGNVYLRAGSTGSTWSKISIGGASHADVGIKLFTAGTERLTILNGGNVGIGITAPGTKLDVSGTFRNSLATTHTLLAGAGNIVVMADSNGNLYQGSSVSGSYLPLTGGALSGDLNMGLKNISAVTKLTVLTIDPLYNIKGVNYSTFASSIAGGVKEEYVGRADIKAKSSSLDNEREYVIDFDKIKEGSDLWVWRQTVDFSPENVEVLITPYGGFAQVYSFIEYNKLILHADRPITVHYRLSGRRVDWKKWPTKAIDQQEKAVFIIE